MRTHGGISKRRSFPKQSTRLYFRSEYGKDRLEFDLFNMKDMNVFYRLIVHSGGSSDQFYLPWRISREWTLVRDPLNHELLSREGGIVSAYHPVRLYINGQPWGIYHIRERIDKYFFKTYYDLEDFDLIKMIDGYEVKEGDDLALKQLLDFLNSNHFADSTNFQQLANLVDIYCFTDFNILNIFIGNWDWPQNNIYLLYDKTETRKWHFIIWDTDISYGSDGGFYGHPPDINILLWATRDHTIEGICKAGDSPDLLWTTLLLRKLLENTQYKTYFISRFMDLMNTTLHPDTILAIFDRLIDKIRPDIEFETNRWDEARVQDWLNGIEVVHSWTNKRLYYQRKQLQNHFNLRSQHDLTLNVQGAKAWLRVNTKYIDHFPWTGVYFSGIPVELEAVPAPGYRFDRWSLPDLPDTPYVQISLNQDLSITAYFVPDTSSLSIRINEIMAQNNSTLADEDGDFSDWIELYNPNSSAINLTGCFLSDDPQNPYKWQFPKFVLPAKAYAIIWTSGKNRKPTNLVHYCFKKGSQIHTNFKLSANGEFIALYRPDGTLIDSLTFPNQVPDISMARFPNGSGPFLYTQKPTPGAPNLFQAFYASLSGNIVNGINHKPIPSAQVVALNDTTLKAQTDATGTFTIQNLRVGTQYIFSFTKPPKNTQAIRIYDAALTARSSVGLTGLDSAQQIAADANLDGTVSVYDAALIARFAVGLPTPNASYVGTWRFVPDIVQTHYPFKQNFPDTISAFLIGDVDGSWSPAPPKTPVFVADNGAAPAISVSQDTLLLTLPRISHPDIVAVELHITFDPEVLSFYGYRLDTEQTESVLRTGEGSLILGAYSLDKNGFLGLQPQLLFTIKNSSYENSRHSLHIQSLFYNNHLIYAGAVENQPSSIPDRFSFGPNYPNPFSNRTILHFALPAGKNRYHVSLNIYDLQGKLVRTLINQPHRPGTYEVFWDGKDRSGNKVPSGIYFVRLKAGTFRKTIKIQFIH